MYICNCLYIILHVHNLQIINVNKLTIYAVEKYYFPSESILVPLMIFVLAVLMVADTHTRTDTDTDMHRRIDTDTHRSMHNQTTLTFQICVMRVIKLCQIRNTIIVLLSLKIPKPINDL